MKPLDAFSRDATKGDGFRSSCRSCAAEGNAGYRVSHVEAIRERLAAWYVKNRARAHNTQQAYRLANPEAVSQTERKWRQAHRPSVEASCERHRILKRTASGAGVTTAQWRDVLVESLGLCAYCNESKKLSMDHVEPLSTGGAHDVSNVVAACKSCNSSKHKSLLVVWLARRAA